MVSYIITSSGTINLVKDGRPYSVAPDHVNYSRIVAALKSKSYDGLEAMIDVAANVFLAAQDTTESDNIEVKNGLIYYKGFIVDNSLTRRIIEMIQGGFPFQPMVNFLENLMQNPSSRAIRELYDFLEVNSLPITEDGYLLAYKRVREDWKDFYTGTIDHGIGTRPKMDRNLVDDNKDRTCSSGLHFCSLAYLSEYHGGEGRAIIVKINPRDVVSIPTDYANAKGRCCEYEVIGEHAPTGNVTVDEKTEAFDEPVYDNKGARVDRAVLGKKPNGDAFWNVRDKHGRFTKTLRDKNGRFVSKK
jgi:hypothetical protein